MVKSEIHDELDHAIEKIQEDIRQLELKSAALQQSRPQYKPRFPSPRLRLKVLDLDHPGAEVFFTNSSPSTVLSRAVQSVLSVLYEPTRPNKHIPPTRSVTLILRSMDGLADTIGSDTDNNDKKIHFSLDYIDRVSKRPKQPGQPSAEIQGVLVHEMVHCWQWNGLGTAPIGLTEGIADFVRLKAGLSPAHWKREAGDKWDAGYQITGYFLEWIEDKLGEGSVRKINQALQEEKYEEDKFWGHLFGRQVADMWKEYSRGLDQDRTKAAGDDEQNQSASLTEDNSNVKTQDPEGRDKVI